MKLVNKIGLIVLTLAIVAITAPAAHAGTSPTLNALSNYSVLGGAGVTCIGATTTSGAVGVSPSASITGFPVPCIAGGGTQLNNASAIAAQAEALTTFGTLNQPCDFSYGAQDLTLLSPLAPGVYCSTSSFTLSGNLTLTGTGVWIFKTVSTLITSPGSSVTGGDPCNIWWRIGSSTTLDTTTSFRGTIISQDGTNAMNTGAILDGRFLALEAGTVTLDSNTLNGPTCTGSGGGTTPGLPNTGTASQANNNLAILSIPATLFILAPALYLLNKKRKTFDR